MITNNEKDKLAQLCEFGEERYTDKVKEGAEENYPFLQDEIAILRKQESVILQWIQEKFGEDIRLPEFIEYNNTIEEIKKKSREFIN